MRTSVVRRGLIATVIGALIGLPFAAPAQASLAWDDDPCEFNGGQVAVAPDMAAYADGHPVAYVVCKDGTLLHHGIYGKTTNSPVFQIVGDDVVDVTSTSRGAVYTVTANGYLVEFGTSANTRVTDYPLTGVVGIESTLSGKGFWMVTKAGKVAGVGEAPSLRLSRTPSGDVTAFAARSLYGGWVVTASGDVVPVGSAPNHGSVTADLAEGERAVGIVADRRSGGFWVVTDHGDVIAKGGAPAETGVSACLAARGATPPFTGAVGDPRWGASAPLWTYSVNGGICGYNPYA